MSHVGVLYKLGEYGICRELLAWLASYLKDRSIQVVVGGMTSKRHIVRSGVPQGSVLGPLLFLVYVNDLEDFLPAGVELAVYADDTTLYVCIDRRGEAGRGCSNLQKGADALSEWGERCRVTFEPTKSRAITFSLKRSRWEVLEVALGGTPVPEEGEVKLLGVVMDERLTYRKHIKVVSSRASQRLGLMRRTQRILNQEGLCSVYMDSFARSWSIARLHGWGQRGHICYHLTGCRGVPNV